MIYPIFSVKDQKSGYQTPFCDVNVESAKRGFGYAISQSGLMSSCAKDYDLYIIGTFNTESGVIEKYDSPSLVIEGTNLVRKDDT